MCVGKWRWVFGAIVELPIARTKSNHGPWDISSCSDMWNILKPNVSLILHCPVVVAWVGGGWWLPEIIPWGDLPIVAIEPHCYIFDVPLYVSLMQMSLGVVVLMDIKVDLDNPSRSTSWLTKNQAEDYVCNKTNNIAYLHVWQENTHKEKSISQARLLVPTPLFWQAPSHLFGQRRYLKFSGPPSDLGGIKPVPVRIAE